ncbi:MAG: 4-alpha-glucanotransferase, partial [Myxococcales bacterium]
DTLQVRLAPGVTDAAVPAELAVELRYEDGRVTRHEGRAAPDAQGRAVLALAGEPVPLGRHELRCTLHPGTAAALRGQQDLLVVPRRCHRPGGRRAGLLTQLYSVREERGLGAGDLGTLGRLVRWAAGFGADFVGVNPLHALDLSPGEISPYSPWSRRFVHPLYLDLEQVPELATCGPARALMESAPWHERSERLRHDPHVRHGEVLELKLRVLRQLHAEFRKQRERGVDTRGRAYQAYLEREGEALEGHARFSALAAHFGAADYRHWPSEFHDRRSDAVEQLATRLHSEVDFHRFLQFELARQLEDAAALARSAGMEQGLYADLAVGSLPGGSDAWAQPDLFASGVSIGAPPDPFAEQGQSWGLAPIIPWASHQQGHAFFAALVASSARWAGLLRIDHVMGLTRQFWVPDGHTAQDGAYVEYPLDDWLGVVALQSVRHRCTVVGEDLGTVPEGLRETLIDRGLLRSLVLYFERDHEGRFFEPDHYAADALLTANTHDLATLWGKWEGRDLRRRHELGLFDDGQLHATEHERDATRHRLMEALWSCGCLPHGQWPRDAGELLRAVCDFMAQTRCLLLGVSLDDVTGEREAINIPGTTAEQADNWTRRLSRSLESLQQDDALGAWLREWTARVRATDR